MIYLLAKYALLFLFTGLLGFALGHWFARRNFVDVTKSYEDLQTAQQNTQSQWDKLWSRLDNWPQPETTDLKDVYARLDGVSATLSRLPKPVETDLTGVIQRLDGVSGEISQLPKPEPVSFAAVEQRLDSLSDTIRAIPVPEVPERVDLVSIEQRLDNLDNSIRAIPQPETPDRVDLEPVNQRLSAIETELTKIRGRIQTSEGKVKSPSLQPTQRPSESSQTSEPRILSAALYGKKDDLKLISGVGPKLERLLNKNGVFYFWQVAEWNRKDIDVIDERLDVFKGRILRDNWVRQAKDLKSLPTAAAMPAL